MACTFHSVN